MNKEVLKDILLPLVGVLIGGAITLAGTIFTIDSQFELIHVNQKCELYIDILQSTIIINFPQLGG